MRLATVRRIGRVEPRLEGINDNRKAEGQAVKEETDWPHLRLDGERIWRETTVGQKRLRKKGY
jgi:hypothetical protein